ncbi:MAG: enoyl-CoA hydratase/isomerase family protein [Myxococcaceae bacterium]
MAGTLTVEDREGGLRVLTLQNPSKRNALDDAMFSQLRAALLPGATAGVRAFLVRGDDTAFCSGYDLSSLGQPAAEGVLPDEHIVETFSMLARHPSPSVALLTGPAFGAGCELASACDFRVASGAAVLCMPPAKLGVVYSPEGLWRLGSLIGPSKAKLMFLTGRKVDAHTAHRWGLLDELWLDGGAESRAFALCEELTANGPLAVRGMKRGFEHLFSSALSEAERRELDELRRAAFNSEDVQEGLRAFLAKRAPAFKGR